MPGEIVRVNISPDLQEIRQHGFEAAPTALTCSHPHNLKRLAYTAAVFPSEDVIHRALAQRAAFPPFGLAHPQGGPVQEFDKDHPFKDLGHKMRHTLRKSAAEMFENCPHLVAEGIKNADQVINLSKQLATDAHPPLTDLKHAIDGGIIGASLIFPQFLNLIPNLYQTPQDHSVYTQTARANEALGVRLAAQHGARFSAIFREIRIDETEFDERFGPQCYQWHFNPDRFNLTPGRKGVDIIEIKPEVMERAMLAVAQIRENYPDSDDEIYCPAIRALSALWHWNVDIADYIYSKHSSFTNAR